MNLEKCTVNCGRRLWKAQIQRKEFFKREGDKETKEGIGWKMEKPKDKR